MPTIIINGFSSTDKVPGAYGEVLYGAGATSAASLPLQLLLVGLKLAAGTATADTQVVPIFSKSDAVNYFGAGSQLARQCMAALLVPGVSINAIAVAEAGGAVAATATITIAGTWTSAWTFSYRVAGKTYTGTVGATDTIQTAATNIAAAFNADADCPVTAAVGVGPGYVVTLTVKSKGTTGNSYVLADTSVKATGATSAIAGGTALTGGLVPFSGGTGTENVTNVLATINPTRFDRIGIGQLDAANLALYKTQIDAQAGVLSNIRQHAVCASNGTLAAATSLAQTTLNDQRFQHLWFLNSETHPGEIAAAMTALRAQREQTDPDAAYDNVILAGVAPQSQRADWANHATLVSALNNGVTPVNTDTTGFARIVRSIVTHSLNGANPDYSTLDTGDAVVPDFILLDLQLYWTTQIVPNNPRVMDNVASGDRRRETGIITPDMWQATVYAKMKDYEAGKLGGQQIAPIVINVDANLPVCSYDATAKRIMTAVPTIAAPANHQVGISVRQAQAA